MLELQGFIDHYPPAGDVQRASDELIERYTGVLPDPLLELWRESGFGRYGAGIVQLVNPDEYRDILLRWLNRDEDDSTRIPVALSAFGHVFYYRNLSDEGDEDISELEPHVAESFVLAWSLVDFFNDFLCDEEAVGDSLQPELFSAAVERLGNLDDGQIFAYTPALKLGGDKAIARLTKVDARVHLEFLLELLQ